MDKIAAVRPHGAAAFIADREQLLKTRSEARDVRRRFDRGSRSGGLGDIALGRYQHWEIPGHCLQHGNRKPLAQGRKNERIGRA